MASTNTNNAPKGFVDWISVTKILEHTATGGIRTIILSQTDGSLLAIGHAVSSSTGNSVHELPVSAKVHKQNADCVTSALVSNIWHNYAAFTADQDLQTLLVDCESGQISVAKVGPYLLGVVANHTIQPGMLRGKMSSHLGGIIMTAVFTAGFTLRSNIPNMLDSVTGTDFYSRAADRKALLKQERESRPYMLRNGLAPPSRDREFPKWA